MSDDWQARSNDLALLASEAALLAEKAALESQNQALQERAEKAEARIEEALAFGDDPWSTSSHYRIGWQDAVRAIRRLLSPTQETDPRCPTCGADAPEKRTYVRSDAMCDDPFHRPDPLPLGYNRFMTARDEANEPDYLKRPTQETDPE
jgi:hypothetical protein